ncbi:signal peptidase II [Lacticaseibacillus pabuli]|uniref:Lipoprotein signal peptidase n=1 Tax=Lacticaseibacillus pabuli TaxID=3025672 RepID=A0ABY7WMU1_9LACO|nr:signal peptidase II [Lacticaseibacillus sp. KACC 23028]WDF81528.1 signal peptidase II [Lacticaseibacillus sp. KACC 23028]
MLVYLLITIATLALDIIVKALVVANIPVGASVTVIPGVLSLTHLQNTGAAWSMFQGQQWFFYIITVVALAAVAFMWRDSKGHVLYRLGLALMVSGALGNFIDRVHQQYVTDMFQLDFINFPIFNIADLCLTLGVIFVMIYIFFLDKSDK